MKLTKIWLAIYLWFQPSGAVIYPKEIIRAVPFSVENIAWALVRSSQGKIKYKVQLPNGYITEAIWNSPLEIPDTVDSASDVIPVFVVN